MIRITRIHCRAAMLSRKLLSSFLNARGVDDSEKKLPSALYPYRCTYASLSEPITKNGIPTRVDLGEQKINLWIQEPICEEEVSTNPTISKGIQDGLRHLNVVGEIKLRREASRMKYQEILLKRSSSCISSVSSTVSSGSSGRSSVSLVSQRRKPKQIRRQISDIDDEDDDYLFLLEAETFSTSRAGDGKIPRAYGSSISLDTLEHNSDDSVISKKRPFIKRYAEEYNMLVTAVSKFFTKERRKDAESSLDQSTTAVIKFGTLKKISHMDVGVGVDVFVELRLGMMTYYKNVGDEELSDDVKSMPITRELCTCRPTKSLKKPPFPKWDAVFEVSLNDRPTHFFMAESVDERQEWINAFAVAMHMEQACSDEERQTPETQRYEGEANIRGHNADILLYLHVRGLIQGACYKDEYMQSISILLGKTISVPVRWLREYFEFEDSPGLLNDHEGTPEDWERMENEIISVNGHIARGELETIVGSLKSHIVDLDGCACSGDGIVQPRIKESRAIFFARDILLSCDRIRSEEQAIYCTSKMVGNDKLTFLTPGSAEVEPLKISLRSLSSNDHTSAELRQETHANGHAKHQPNASPEEFKFTVEVIVRFPNIYRICSTDPMSDNETWALMRTNYVQKFVIGPTEIRQMDPFVHFEIVPY